MRKTLAMWMSTTATTSGEGKASKTTKTKGTKGKKGPMEKITQPGQAKSTKPIKESAAATVTSGSEYPAGAAPLTKAESPIIIDSGDEDETTSTPQSAATDTELTQVIG